MKSGISNSLLEILRCPAHPDVGQLSVVRLKECIHSFGLICDAGLECQHCGTKFPIVDGIPDMVIRNGVEGSFFEAEAKQWDEQTAIYDDYRKQDAQYMACVDAVVESISPTEGDFILDAACGTGLTIEKYCHINAHIVAYDLSIESLRYLKKKFLNASLDFVRGNLIALPFYENVFSKVLCANAIQHIPDKNLRQNCVRELSRVARPNARITLSVHNLSIPKKRAGWIKEGKPSGSHSGGIQYIYRYELPELYSLLAPSLVVDSITGARYPFRIEIN